jgi:hypothetical protein
MGTEGSETSATMVTIDDFKTLESSMVTQMGDLRKMIAHIVEDRGYKKL